VDKAEMVAAMALSNASGPAPEAPGEPGDPDEPDEPTAAPSPSGKFDKSTTVTFIGDSVALGARQELAAELPKGYIDTEGSRPLTDGREMLNQLRQQGALGQIVVVSLGTNGNDFWKDAIEGIIADLEPGKRLVFVTPYDGHANDTWWSSETAVYERTLPAKYPFVQIADWNEAIKPRAQLLGADKIHVGGNAEAIGLYTDCVMEALDRSAAGPAKP
jgi:hypothetical protein